MYKYLVCMGILLLGGTSFATPTPQTLKQTSLPANHHCRVTFQGIDNLSFASRLKELSKLHTDTKRLYTTFSGLIRCAKRDAIAIKKALKTQGYREAHVDYEITGHHPRDVIFNVNIGPLYKIDSLQVHLTTPCLEGVDLCQGLPLQRGSIARADHILETEDAILYTLKTHGFLYGIAQDMDATENRQTKTVSVVYNLNAGQKCVFGDVHIKGTTQADSQWILRYIPWNRGETFDIRHIEKLKNVLFEKDVFQAIDITFPTNTSDCTIPVTLTLTDRKRRFIGGALSFSTRQGLGIKGFWGHRNVFNNGEKLSIESQLTKVKQGVATSLRLLDFWMIGQDLVFALNAHHERVKSYDSYVGTFTTRVDHKFSEKCRVSSGITFEVSRTRNFGANRRRELVRTTSLPNHFLYDTTDNALMPTSGFRFEANVEPTILSRKRGFSSYAMVKIAPNAYLALDKKKHTILAGRLCIGSLIGASRSGNAADPLDNIARNRRFFAGGGESIRGYGFKKVAPLDTKGIPIGGFSLFEAGLELRFRISERVGIVPFVEAGNAYLCSMPDLFNKGLLWGAGLGIRYYIEGIGPIRADIAFPFKRRRMPNGKFLDSAFQLYFGIGESF